MNVLPRGSRWLLVVAAAAVCAPPARAQSHQELMQELRALQARVAELERKLEAQAVAEPVPPGMTEEQLQEFNRIVVKTEGLEDARDMLGFKGFKVGGYMDPTYVVNQRQHRAGFQFLNAVRDGGYSYDNSYFGSVAIDFIKETDGGPRWRLTLVPQRSSQAVAEGSNSVIQEASVSVPLSDLQTRFIAGHLPDWSGYEALQPTLNKLITHNLLFDLTLPAAYTGAGLELLRGKWWTRAMLANMNGSKRAGGERTPVLAYRVDYAKGEFQGFGFAGVHGRAANLTQNVRDPATGDVRRQPDSRVDLFEVDAYFIRGDWTVQGQLSWGHQEQAAITPALDGRLRDARWVGLSALAAYKFEPRLEGIVRLDYLLNEKHGGGLLTYAVFDGLNGIGPDQNGTDADRGVNRGALTLGLNYALNLNTNLKFEYRYDWATGAVFEDVAAGGFRRHNQLLSTAVVVSF